MFYSFSVQSQTWSIDDSGGRITKTGDGTYTIKYYNSNQNIRSFNLSRTSKKTVVGDYNNNVIVATYSSDDDDYYFVINWVFGCSGKGRISEAIWGGRYSVGNIIMYDALDSKINDWVIYCND
jgi:hypothetical protein